MTQFPEWAMSEGFDPASDWWSAIVCTGGREASMKHPVELVGILRDTVHPLLGEASREIVARPKDGGYYIELSDVDGLVVDRTLGFWMMLDERGSTVVSCPSCPRVHRIGRIDFVRFLGVSYRTGQPWADVSGLD